MHTNELSDSHFLAAVLDGSLPPAQFDHRGHLRFAWLQLQGAPLDAAIEAICNGIEHFAARHGVPGKFHRTISEALVRLMAHGGAATLPWDAFLRINAHLLTDAGGTLARHYSAERLGSAQARASFVPPDRLALP